MQILLPYLLDIVGPFVTYLVVDRLGAGGAWALLAGGAIAALTTGINTIRHRGLDRLGVLVLLEIAASLLLLLLARNPRALLIRPSFYTGIAAVYLLSSVFAGRPLSFDGAKPMAASGGPERLAAYERAWQRSREFRWTHGMVTFGFAAALAADSLLRVIIVYKLPVERSIWISNLPHMAAVALIVVTSAAAGRRFKRIVDAELPAANQRQGFSFD